LWALGGKPPSVPAVVINSSAVSRTVECSMVKFDEVNQGPPAQRKRGLVIGELLVALLLLAVAVSSLAALMYSVSRRPTTEPIQCAGKAVGSSGSCAEVPNKRGGAPSKLRKRGGA